MSILFDRENCTYEKAKSAWNKVFYHDFWRGTAEGTQRATENKTALPYYVVIECGMAKKEHGPVYAKYASGTTALPKGIALRFSVFSTNVPEPYSIHWIVSNEGHEAEEFDELSWERSNIGDECWTSTKYKGRHTMTCRLKKDGITVAENVFVVKISGGGRWRIAA